MLIFPDAYSIFTEATMHQPKSMTWQGWRHHGEESESCSEMNYSKGHQATTGLHQPCCEMNYSKGHQANGPSREHLAAIIGRLVALHLSPPGGVSVETQTEDLEPESDTPVQPPTPASTSSTRPSTPTALVPPLSRPPVHSTGWYGRGRSLLLLQQTADRRPGPARSPSPGGDPVDLADLFED